MPDSKTVVKKCLFCNKEFSSFVSEKSKFCCKLCYRMWQNKKVINKCEECGKDFLAHLCQKRRFCSKECRHLGHSKEMSQQISKECEFCLGVFHVSPSHLSQNFCSLNCFHNNCKRKNEIENGNCINCQKLIFGDRKKYCSTECMAESYKHILQKEKNPNWRGGKTLRGSGVPSHIRKKVLLRDNNRCQDCGVGDWNQTPSLLHVHHLDEAKNNGSNSLDNLITLCFVCHWSGKHGFKLNDTLQGIALSESCGIKYLYS
jgi:hypothetical protein